MADDNEKLKRLLDAYEEMRHSRALREISEVKVLLAPAETPDQEVSRMSRALVKRLRELEVEEN